MSETLTPSTEPVTYTPDSVLRSPRGLVAAMSRDLLSARQLAWQLAWRDIRARYRQSLLGILWAFAPPIVTTLLFVSLDRAGVVTLSKGQIPVPAFCLFGVVLWQLFADAINSPLKMVTANRDMIVKVRFPHEALVLAGAMQALFDFCIRSLVLIPFLIFYGLTPGWGILAAPVAILALLLFGVVLGTLMVPLGMLYTDTSRFLEAALPLWMFLTPVIYTQPKGGLLSWIILLNPVSALLVSARDLLTLGYLQQPLAFASVAAITLGMVGVSWLIYRVSFPILIERLGS